MSKLFHAISWSAIEKYSTQIFQFVTSVILARILVPEDYGIIAIILFIRKILLKLIFLNYCNVMMSAY